MKFKNFFIVLIIFFATQNYLSASTVYYLDFKSILNESVAGKKAQETLKKKLDQGIKNIDSKTKKILDEEKKLIEQKKIISTEEYKKKVTELRKDVEELKNQRGKLLKGIAAKRSKARKDLLKVLNPILEKYMIENKIQMVIDKKDVLLADDKLNITSKIMELLNKNLKTINIE
tara:strand:- start:45 stop:566 length:522 start_codon:yes stop_codon:yes gene_type:complete